MRALVLIVCLGLTHAQQAIDPAYLRQYYQQIAQQAGSQGAQRGHEATPVYEPGPQEQQINQQYVQQPQQIRVKDNVNDQVRLKGDIAKTLKSNSTPRLQIRQQYIQQQQARQYQPQQYQIPQQQVCFLLPLFNCRFTF
jgi:hypothetical protein